MRLAWFHPGAPDESAHASHTASAEVGRTHDVTHFTAATAHTFIPAHFRTPFDLCVYEVGSQHRDFAIPYALHVPGIVSLHDIWLPDPRLTTSLLVTGDAATAMRLGDVYGVNVRVAPVAAEAGHVAHESSPRIRVGARTRRDVLDRAIARAATIGVDMIATTDLDAADLIVSLEWPPTGLIPDDAVRALAAGRPAIVLETEATAAWPALDAQTWQPRGIDDAASPVVVSLDPRDEEHSLMLALRRLATDGALRRQLGEAGRAWWQAHHTPGQAREAWLRIIEDAAAMTFAPAPGLLDGTQRARELLGEVGASVDFL